VGYESYSTSGVFLDGGWYSKDDLERLISTLEKMNSKNKESLKQIPRCENNQTCDCSYKCVDKFILDNGKPFK